MLPFSLYMYLIFVSCIVLQYMWVAAILRYLQQGFSRALSHVNPDIVIFLGDLLDEGSEATDELYQQYTRRFHNIFATPLHVKV